MTTKKPMRLAFGEMLCEMGEMYSNLVVLDADVSSSTQTKWFGEKYPARFFNFGIAEANMVSAAAGMAAHHMLPVASTFAFLMTLRAGDPIRSLIAYNNLNVKLAGGYAGLSDFADGASHQSIMDVAVMRAMPNMTVLAPSDIEKTRGAVRAMLEHQGPVYLRLSRAEVGSLHNGDEGFEIGRAEVISEGRDLTIAVAGSVLSTAIEACEQLKKEGIMATLIEYGTIKPFDAATLLKYAEPAGIVLTIEEHNIIGGLGSAVSEAAAESGRAITVKRLGIKDAFGESGTYTELLNRHGLSVGKIVEAVRNSICIK